MHPIRHCLILILLMSTGLAAIQAEAASGRIYRTVDENGNVVFTDVPPREDEPAEQVVIETPNTFASEDAVPEADAWVVEDADEEPFSYNTLSIASPPDDEPLRENAGNVTIVANVNPKLQPGHIMRLLLDGGVAREGPQTSFQLTDVDRGTHKVVLEIVDRDGTVLKRSDPSTFHLQRIAITPAPRG